jgi:thioredoxin 1
MASDKVKTFTDGNFDSETGKGVVLVDFWAEWCGPCRRIAPIVEQLATEYEGKATIGKMNVDENPDIPTNRFMVRGIPTLVVLKDGQLVDTLVGLRGKEEITQVLNKHLA